MQTFDSLMEKNLMKSVDTEIERLKTQLSVNTYETVGEFKYIMGKIAALHSIEEMIDDAKRQSDQSNR
jgi:hypothetical protein